MVIWYMQNLTSSLPLCPLIWTQLKDAHVLFLISKLYKFWRNLLHQNKKKRCNKVHFWRFGTRPHIKFKTLVMISGIIFLHLWSLKVETHLHCRLRSSKTKTLNWITLLVTGFGKFGKEPVLRHVLWPRMLIKPYTFQPMEQRMHINLTPTHVIYHCIHLPHGFLPRLASNKHVCLHEMTPAVFSVWNILMLWYSQKD